MANYGKTSGRNWAIFALVILLAAAIFFGVVTEGFRNWDTSTWFGKKETDQSAVIDDEGNEMDSETVYALPRAMVYSPAVRGATPETTVTVKAVIEPADATNQLVDWEIAFVNPSSEWATGKTVTDYVSLDADNSLTATVTFKEAFGEQIQITVTSQDNSAYTDTCTVDCAQKLESTYVTYAAGSGLDGDAAVILNDASGTSSNWALLKMFLETEVQKAAQITHNTTQVYTIEDEYTTTVTIAPSAELLAKAQEINPAATSGSYDATAGITPNSDFFAQLLGEAFANESDLYELGKALDAKEVANPFIVTVTTTSTYTDDVTNTYYLAYTANDVGKPVTGIHFEDDTIIF